MVYGLIGFVITVIAAIIIAITINNARKKEKTKMSFREALDLTGIPIVTFECSGTKLNFILDTGSSGSHINTSVLQSIKDKIKCDYTMEVFGMEGTKVNCDYYKLNIKYKNQIFTEEFSSTDLSAAFDNVKKESGVQLHGIIGSKFLEKYKYIMDFNELIAYVR